MKWLIFLMFLIYVGTMVFLVYMRIRPAIKKVDRQKRSRRNDGKDNEIFEKGE
ncbi:hypothetical protein GWK41_09820 [Persephonella atlantica]|uniref:Uncharacterized protein n=1 Tax=Persephonella atlantica TaxID=2699429 RepID=A0ABS1GKA7_9AQUI|nr:hypothetical protein [Persephonella atlantica]MBK3333364.1 hypothetical protein [Persephonella atlantica]